MRNILLAVTLTIAPTLAAAEDVWRWKDAGGALHYSNVAGLAPSDATVACFFDAPIAGAKVGSPWYLPGSPA